MNYYAAQKSALVLAIIERAIDERDLSSDTNFMLSIPPLAQAIETSTKYEREIERKQRE